MINGHNFGQELKRPAHEDGSACTALAWGARNDLILTGDDKGTLKIWKPNFVPLSEFATNHQGVRDITWAPGEQKFATCGKDGSARIWDTERCAMAGASSATSTSTTVVAPSAPAQPNSTSSSSVVEEISKLEGHGSEVATMDWHPFHSLVATGSQDRDIRLWDPREPSAGSVATLQGHMETVKSLEWHSSGQYLISGSFDKTARLWDLRVAKEITTFQKHAKINRVRWHPTHKDVFVTASQDGMVLYWTLDGNEGGLQHGAQISGAHGLMKKETPHAINDVAFSPTGHVLSTCAYDVRIWHRTKPGSLVEKEHADDETAIDAL